MIKSRITLSNMLLNVLKSILKRNSSTNSGDIKLNNTNTGKLVSMKLISGDTIIFTMITESENYYLGTGIIKLLSMYNPQINSAQIGMTPYVESADFDSTPFTISKHSVILSNYKISPEMKEMYAETIKHLIEIKIEKLKKEQKNEKEGTIIYQNTDHPKYKTGKGFVQLVYSNDDNEIH